MSVLSRKLIKQDHKGVHEQFDCVYAAMLAYKSLHGKDTLSTALRTHHKRFIKNEIKKAMEEIGFKPGFLRSGLGFYAYEFWEVIVNDRLGANARSDEVIEITENALLQMAEYLEEQFQNDGKADLIAFLKNLL